MTDKRGTGAEYGQEKLRERSAEVDTPESKKKVGKKKLLSVIVAAVIAGGAMAAVILTSDKTPAEKVEALSVDVGENGIALTEPVKTQLAEVDIQSNDNDGEPASSASEGTLALEISGDKHKESATVEPPATSKSSEVDDSDAVPTPPTEAAAPTTEVKPAGEIVSATLPTAKATEKNDEQDLSKFGYQADAHGEKAEAEEKPIDSAEPSPAPAPIVEPVEVHRAEVIPAISVPAPEKQIRLERVEQTVNNQYVQPGVMMTGADLDYTGTAVQVEYKPQQQDTVYLYSTFAAKVFLLPTDKGENISAYLSDEKGWQLKLLPGGILRVQRSENKAAWSQATDLFIVSGKRTYSLILQGVGDPSKRTDSLRYISAETEKKSSAKPKK